MTIFFYFFALFEKKPVFLSVVCFVFRHEILILLRSVWFVTNFFKKEHNRTQNKNKNNSKIIRILVLREYKNIRTE